MIQSSVYKRDFRDPRQSENLWKFLFGRKSSNIDSLGSSSDSQEISIKQQYKFMNNSDQIETKSFEDKRNAEPIQSMTAITTTCHDNKNLCRTKSMTCEKFNQMGKSQHETADQTINVLNKILLLFDFNGLVLC